MIAYLLDGQISPAVSRQLRAKRQEISITRVLERRGGELAGTANSRVLAGAFAEKWTLVTYDRRTIPAVLGEMGASGSSHAGMIFIGERTIAPNDVGGLIRALGLHWDRHHHEDWTDRIDYLQYASP